MSDLVLSTLDGGVLTLTLNRPEALNALNAEMTGALRDGAQAAARNPEVGAVIITGAGRAFCAGGDLKDGIARRGPRGPDLGTDPPTQYARLARAIRAGRARPMPRSSRACNPRPTSTSSRPWSSNHSCSR